MTATVARKPMAKAKEPMTRENIAESIGISPNMSKTDAIVMASLLSKGFTEVKPESDDTGDENDEESSDDSDGNKAFNPYVAINHSNGRYVVKIFGLPKAKNRNIIHSSFFAHMAKKLKHYHVRGRRKKVVKREENSILDKKPYWGSCPCFNETRYYMAFSYVINQSHDGTLQVEFFPNSAFSARWQGKDRRMTCEEIRSAMMNDVLLPYQWNISQFLNTLKDPADAFSPYSEEAV